MVTDQDGGLWAVWTRLAQCQCCRVRVCWDVHGVCRGVDVCAYVDGGCVCTFAGR